MKITDFNAKTQRQIRAQLQTAEQHNEPQIGHSQLHEVNRPLQNPILEPPVRHEPLGENKGKTPRPRRVIVRFTSYRRKLLDRTNAEGGVKFLEDALVYAGIVSGDSEAEIDRTVRQVKVKTSAEECTTVEVI